MTQIFRTVSGNTSPTLSITLKRDDTVIDVTSATVILILTKERTGSVVNSANQSCTLSDPTNGVVTWTPSSADLPSAGRYIGEIKITFAGGKIERIYEALLVVVRTATT